MRKLIFIVITLLTINTYSQVYNHNSRVRIKTTSTAGDTDNIASLDASGLVNRTQITVQQLMDVINGGGGTQTLDQVLTEGNTSSNVINLTGTGDKLNFSFTGGGEAGLSFDVDATDYELKVVSSRSSSNLIIEANNSGTLTIPFSVSDQNIIVSGTRIESSTPVLEFKDSDNSVNTLSLGISSTLSSNVSVQLPERSGTLALTSDNDDWLNVSGTTMGDNLLVTIGDHEENNNGTKIELNDNTGVITLESGENVLINESPLILGQPLNLRTNGTHSAAISSSNLTNNRLYQLQDRAGDIPVYNETTYTPVLNNTAGGNYTATNLIGNYQRIGNVVRAEIIVQGLNGSTGEFNVSLPFTSVRNSAGNILRITNSDLTDSQLGLLVANANLGNVVLLPKNSDTASSGITFTNGQLQIQVTYVTNAP